MIISGPQYFLHVEKKVLVDFVLYVRSASVVSIVDI